MCDAGNPCSPPPPVATASPPPPPPPPSENSNTGANGFTGSCNRATSYVYSCKDAVSSCYGSSPTLAQVNNIFSQSGCSTCQSGTTARGVYWSWSSKSSDGYLGYFTSGGLVSSFCEITSDSMKINAASLSFCCDM